MRTMLVALEAHTLTTVTLRADADANLVHLGGLGPGRIDL